MINTNAVDFREQVLAYIEQTIKFNEPVNISTTSGNAVLISEEQYNSLMETLYLTSIPGMKEKLEAGVNTPIEECFEITNEVPNAETIAAIQECEDIVSGKISAKRYSTAREMIDDIMSEENDEE